MNISKKFLLIGFLATVSSLQATSLDAMAEEAAMSRLYGGIHYRHDNEDGLALGRKVSEMVLKKMWR